ncbi:hypothetical protein WJX73_007997 [Symbiochloris irregularis]|uniref:Arogenate dehydratase n=1 Tax=Symbiochloris irregularis TaxID=706552 RepID=A0AAW1PV48_9CHLO
MKAAWAARAADAVASTSRQGSDRQAKRQYSGSQPPSKLSRSSLLRSGSALTSEAIARALGRQEENNLQDRVSENRVAYQGMPGAFSEQAARQACPDSEPTPCEHAEMAFQLLTQWLVERAVLPIENAQGGSIHAVYDLLMRYRLHIVGEVSMDVQHCLAARPGVRREDVKRVMSHPNALAQCSSYLHSWPGVVRETASDTAAAAKAVAQQGLRDSAAIASEPAAQMYGLEILDRNIQDTSSNITRFIVLARDAMTPAPTDTRRFKTSIVFSLPGDEESGQLFKALSVFALRDIDMTKIESRPQKSQPIASAQSNLLGQRFQYLFYVDFAASLSDPTAQNALRHLQEIAPFMRVLGTYPLDEMASMAGSLDNSAMQTLKRQLMGSRSNGASPAASIEPPAEPVPIPAAPIVPAPLEKERKPAGLSVAYQGMPGAYSEMAARKAVAGCEPLPCDQFEVAFQALDGWIADRAVLPIENSLGGSIHAVYDLLIRYRAHIVGEVTVDVNHQLLALPGIKLSDITRVISHWQALAQVDGYLRALPGVVRQAVDDTAGAAELIAKNQWRDVAAVASVRAGELYGLETLDSNIQDNPNNITRFLLLARDPLITQPNDKRQFKTSIVFSMPERAGQLFKALSVFALRGIDLTKIESRPLQSRPLVPFDTPSAPARGARFNYLFHIDILANLADEKAQNALRHLQEIAPFMRVLGCYPMYVEAHVRK